LHPEQTNVLHATNPATIQFFFIFGPKATALNTYSRCGRMQRRAAPSFNGWDSTRGE